MSNACVEPIEKDPSLEYRVRTNHFSQNFNVQTNRKRAKARQAYAKLLMGMKRGECVFFTLTWGYDEKMRLRSLVWRHVGKAIGDRWPESAAATSYEWSGQRGGHLHVVVRGAPDLDEAWVKGCMARFDYRDRPAVRPAERPISWWQMQAAEGVDVLSDVMDGRAEVGGWRTVWDGSGLCSYITKQIGAEPAETSDDDTTPLMIWPAHHRFITFTHNWAPDWQPKRDWKRGRRGKVREEQKVVRGKATTPVAILTR
jgi:hypothetical protein